MEKTSDHEYTIGESFNLSSISSDLHWSDDTQISDYEFTHWTSSEIDQEPFYVDKAEVVFSEISTDLYAQWKKVWFNFIYDRNVNTVFRTQTSGDVYFSIEETGNILRPQNSKSSGIISPYKEKIGTYRDNILGVKCSEEINNIGNYAFYYCQKLTEIDCSDVSAIGTYSLYNCGNLLTVNCQNVQQIGDFSFAECNGIESIECPKVKTIANYAFADCDVLSSITCQNVSYIGDYAFNKCSRLSSVSISSASSPPYLNSSNAFSGVFSGYSVWVKNESYKQYLTANNWKDISSHISSMTQPTVSFLSGETYDTLVKVEKMNYGMSAVPPMITREGYELTGWSGRYDDVTQDVSCFARWIEYDLLKTRNGEYIMTRDADLLKWRN